MLSESLLAIGVGLIAYAFYKWATLNNDYFSGRNLSHKKPKFLLGDAYGVFFNVFTAPEFSKMLYNSFPSEKMYGLFDFRRPQLVVRDPDLLKQLTVKDFDHFEDHRPFFDLSRDDLFGNSLFMMKGQRWRDMRATLSPAFTGSKMRQMYPLMTECADGMTKHFLRQSADGKRNDVEMKNLFSRFANDVIASCAFGIRVNSFDEPNNEFFEAAKVFLGSNRRIAPYFLFLFRTIPSILDKFGVQVCPKAVRSFFSTMVIETMDERKERGIFRPDMINLLMQVRQGQLPGEGAVEVVKDNVGFATVEESEIGKKVSTHRWTDEEIISQV